MSVTEMTALTLARAIREGKMSVPELMEEILARKDETDERIRAYLTVDRDAAMEQAKRVQACI
jgi:Asp-tRNA(Asn)/Glu-tRNA(Gln) amidotransferase A subunit family amidase